VRKVGWKQLSPAERIAVAQDLFAAAVAGEADIGAALDLVPLLIAEDTVTSIRTIDELLEDLEELVPEAQRKRYGAWVRAQLGRKAAGLGWLPGPRDDLTREAMRDDIVVDVAITGEEPALMRAAVKLARDYRTLPEAMRGNILVAAVRSRPALADGYNADFRAETARALRADLADALAAVRDPERLQRALALVLDPAIDVRDSLPILQGAADRPENRAIAEAFAVANLDALIARLEGDSAGALIGVLIGGCDVGVSESRRALVEDKLGKVRGARRRIDQAHERVASCAARRAAVAPALVRYLTSRR
jgi:hypothetical protein